MFRNFVNKTFFNGLNSIADGFGTIISNTFALINKTTQKNLMKNSKEKDEDKKMLLIQLQRMILMQKMRY